MERMGLDQPAMTSKPLRRSSISAIRCSRSLTTASEWAPIHRVAQTFMCDLLRCKVGSEAYRMFLNKRAQP